MIGFSTIGLGRRLLIVEVLQKQSRSISERWSSILLTFERGTSRRYELQA